MAYKTESAILRHVVKNLVPKILNNYKLSDIEIQKLLNARKILLKLAKKIDKYESN
jgi:hypothetical protein